MLLGRKPTNKQQQLVSHCSVGGVCRESNSSAIQPEKQGSLDPDIMELYIDLMCQFQAKEVCNFIKMNEGYRLEETLQVQ